jgi:3-hydroxyisobutyrate dehydrogenase-like beta-hydroxyacid dehydrogenase
MVLGTKAGIEPGKLQEILNSGSAHCWALETKIPNVIQGKFEAGFMIDLQHKDIGLALDTGKELHVPLNFAALAHQTYEAARAMGFGRQDHSAVIQVLESIAGQTVRSSK